MFLRMLLLLAAMKLIASLRSLPVAALLLGLISLALLTWDWNTLQRRVARDSKIAAEPAVSCATLCLAAIGLIPSGATLVRICLILVALGLGLWATFRYYKSSQPAA